MQLLVGRLLSILWIPGAAFAMRVVMRYRIRDASKLRKRFRQLVKETDAPILICANHLTMVDSAVMAWALGGSWWYLFNYRWMQWNLPEHTNYGFTWYNRVGVWILKCIPIRRGGRREDVSAALERPLGPRERLFVERAVTPQFHSLDPLAPDYAVLLPDAPEEIRFGAEEGLEMGAWNLLRNPHRIENLRRRIVDYVPFGLRPEPVYVN